MGEGHSLTAGKTASFPDRIPLVVGVTGHRALRDTDIERLKRDVADVFEQLKQDHIGVDGETPIIFLCALAEGADQLVAQVALDHGASLIVPLPLPLDEYRRDFIEQPIKRDAVAVFDALLERAIATPQMPLAAGNRADDIRVRGPKRDRQYRESNLFIARHCHILIALWDGNEKNRAVGGTAEMVSYKRHGVPPQVSNSARASLDGIGIGPVIHVQAPRADAPTPPDECATVALGEPARRAAGSAAQGVRQGAPFSDIAGRTLRDLREFLRDLFGLALSEPSAKPPQEEARALAARSDFVALTTLTRRFNAERASFSATAAASARLAASLAALFGDADNKTCVIDAKDRAVALSPRWCDTYAIVDILARQWQAQLRRDWKILFALGFVAFICLETAAVILPGNGSLLLGYGLAVIGMLGLLMRARLNQHHERALDYRTLAEALRVGIFWKLAGIGGRPEIGAPPASRTDGATDLFAVNPAETGEHRTVGENRITAIADGYPIVQPGELAWVKTVLLSLELLDAAEVQAPTPREIGREAHDWLRRLWVGGQARHFKQKAQDCRLAAQRLKAYSLVLLLLSLAIALVISAQDLGLTSYGLPRWIGLDPRQLLAFVAAMLAGLAAVRVGFSRQPALMAQARQYDRMGALYERAYQMLPVTPEPGCGPLVRDIYCRLGIEVMSQHAEWVSIYRPRPLQPPQAS
jgi:hypothetical protein